MLGTEGVFSWFAARRILELQTSHRRLLWEKKISSPIAVGILEQLFYTPTISIAQIAKRFAVSYQAASTVGKDPHPQGNDRPEARQAIRVRRLSEYPRRRDQDLRRELLFWGYLENLDN
jgi:hypothetical protein